MAQDTHEIAVGKVNGNWKAKPGKIRVKLTQEPKPSITWTPKNCKVTLFFPDPDLFGEHFYDIQSGKPRTLKIKKLVVDKYPYAVYCHKDKDDKDFAEGNSTPIIIIEK